MKRFFFTVMAIGFLLYAPWWMTILVLGVGVFYFEFYIEAIILGFLFDVLYGVSGSAAYGFGILGFLGGVVLYFGVTRLKTNLRYTNNKVFL